VANIALSLVTVQGQSVKKRRKDQERHINLFQAFRLSNLVFVFSSFARIFFARDPLAERLEKAGK